MGNNVPGDIKISSKTPPVNIPVLYDVQTGVGNIISPGYTLEMPLTQMLKSGTRTSEEMLSSLTPLNRGEMLPIFRIGSIEEGAFISSSVFGGPEAQLNRLQQVVQNQAEMLFLVIETFGRQFEKLGQVGIYGKTIGGGERKVYDRASEAWKKVSGNLAASNDIAGDETIAEIVMLREASDALKSNPNAKVGIFNESVDLGKMAQMAKKHANRLTQEWSRGLLGTEDTASITQKMSLAAEMNEASEVFNSAQEIVL